MKSLIISEHHNIAAITEDGKAQDFFVSRNEFSVGDIYTVHVENIMPSINAVFVKLEEGRMGFLHANDIPGNGTLYERLAPGQKLLVQIEKEPTGKKGPRVNLTISIPGRYFVLTTENTSISTSKKISEHEERDRLKAIANLMKPEEFGLVIRTEASGRTKEELEEDFVNLWNIWKNIVDKHEQRTSPGVVNKDKDFLYSVLRDNFNSTIDEIIVSSLQSKYRCEEFLKAWTGREVSVRYIETDQILQKTEVEKELRSCLSKRVDLPSGGYIIIQTMEALTAIDINSGKFTASNSLRETVRRTNMEAAIEIARHIKLRNIGGMIIIDFIDMAEREDRIRVMETLESVLRPDKAKPQVGPLSELCLVEITRKRSGQALSEVFGEECSHCGGVGIVFKLSGQRPSHNHQLNNQNRNDKFNRDRNDRGERNSLSLDRNDKFNRSSSSLGGQNTLPKPGFQKNLNKPLLNSNNPPTLNLNKPPLLVNNSAASGSPTNTNTLNNSSNNKNPRKNNHRRDRDERKPFGEKVNSNPLPVKDKEFIFKKPENLSPEAEIKVDLDNILSAEMSIPSHKEEALEKVFSQIEPKEPAYPRLDAEDKQFVDDLTSQKTFSHFQLGDETV
ncbi:MAG: Rne/Rng family ribonuclease [Cyanobacteria bacterium REEB446]|nr:Rne/Rng family ribonuclease [Cyanobacteria bacterium REEB446]